MSFLKKNFRKILFTLLLLFLMLTLTVGGKIYAATTLFGLKLWATTVLPALLPFFFLTALFSSTGVIEKLSKKLTPLTKFLYGADGISAYIQLMSFASGYPVGAKITADLYKAKLITAKQAEKYSTFTSTSSPTFIIGGIGVGMFLSLKIGVIIFISHVLSSVLSGIIFRKLPDNQPIGGLLPNSKPDNVLYDAMHGAVISVLLVGGFVAVFYTFSKVLDNLGVYSFLTPILSPLVGKELAAAILSGIVECTNGCLLAARANLSLSAPVSAALISFGGISVWCQSFAYLKIAKVRIRLFVFSKITHAALAFIICLVLQALI